MPGCAKNLHLRSCRGRTSRKLEVAETCEHHRHLVLVHSSESSLHL